MMSELTGVLAKAFLEKTTELLKSFSRLGKGDELSSAQVREDGSYSEYIFDFKGKDASGQLVFYGLTVTSGRTSSSSNSIQVAHRGFYTTTTVNCPVVDPDSETTANCPVVDPDSEESLADNLLLLARNTAQTVSDDIAAENAAKEMADLLLTLKVVFDSRL